MSGVSTSGVLHRKKILETYEVPNDEILKGTRISRITTSGDLTCWMSQKPDEKSVEITTTIHLNA
jgi:hypothetical protein